MDKNNIPLIQKIRQELAQKISGKQGVLPSKKQLQKYFTNIANKPSYWYSFIHSLITLDSINKETYTDVINAEKNEINIENAFQILEKNQIEDCIKVELSYCPKPLSEKNCIWIIKDEYEGQLDTEFVILILINENIDDCYTIFVKRNEDNNVTFYFQARDNNLDSIEINEINQAIVQFAAHVFLHFANNPTGNLQGLTWEYQKQKRNNSTYRPPTDPKLMQYLYEAVNKSRECIKATVDLDNVVPYSYSHAFEFPEVSIYDSTYLFEKACNYGILTYIDEGKYVMSDDYSLYLALKVHDKKRITIVNLGDLLTDTDEIIERGGTELLPPLHYQQHTIESLPIEEQKKYLENKVESLKSIKKLKDFLLSDFIDIKKVIADNKLEEAITSLLPYTIDDEDLNLLTTLKARLKKLQNDNSFGIVKYEDDVIEFNRIRISLLKFIDEFKKI